MQSLDRFFFFFIAKEIAKGENLELVRFWEIITSVEQDTNNRRVETFIECWRGNKRLNKFVWAIEWAADG